MCIRDRCSAVSSCPIICVAQSCATPMRIMSFSARVAAVSYTHLDVYKRQAVWFMAASTILNLSNDDIDVIELD